MATCPRCFGALTDNHKCPRGIFSRLTDALFPVGVGGVIGGIVAIIINEQAPTSLVLAAAALGAVLASAVREAIGRRL